MGLLRALFVLAVIVGSFGMGIVTLAEAQSAMQQIAGLQLLTICALFICTVFIVGAIDQKRGEDLADEKRGKPVASSTT